jgi:hypothetical protein
MKTCTTNPAGWGLLALLLLAGGCAKEASRPRVQGKVTYQGKPVAGQTLVLVSEGAKKEFFSQRLPLSAQGTFAGEVPQPGKYKVVIEESLAVQEGRKPADPNRPAIPRKYRNRDTSDEEWTITEGDNYKEIKLK